MDMMTVKIGVKGFKSYYMPTAQFLEHNTKVKIAALGKRVQMATYLSSILQKHGAIIEDIKISTVELPENGTPRTKVIDVVMIEILMSKGDFICQITIDKEIKN